MKLDFIRQLLCPFCVGEIRVLQAIEGSSRELRDGLLACSGCGFEYPVVAGVAILQGPEDRVDIKAETTAGTILGGPSVAELVCALKAGDAVGALGMLLGPTGGDGRLFPVMPSLSGEMAASWMSPPSAHRQLGRKPIPLRRGGRVLRIAKDLYRRSVLPRARLRLAEFLARQGSRLSALEVIDLYYREFSGVEAFNYFAFRFGQPRHLAGLSLATLAGKTEGPILDLACGNGHLTHYFAKAHPGRCVVGVDRDYFRLYVASHYVAPDADFICAPADLPLPFPERFFGAIYCSDAFHYFLHRAAGIRELRRLLSEDGVIMLCRFGNAEVEPREGYELTVGGYRRLFVGGPHRFLGEEELVNCYLARREPDLDDEAPLEALRREKWLSVVIARDLQKFGRGECFADWPHAVGRLQINPIYLDAGTGRDGGLDLAFQFPSSWYEFENRRYREYAPARCALPSAVVQGLQRGERLESMDSYIRQFVLLGMPENYARRGVV